MHEIGEEGISWRIDCFVFPPQALDSGIKPGMSELMRLMEVYSPNIMLSFRLAPSSPTIMSLGSV